jgi:multiple sugar transport system substrate-binding protein
VLVIMLLIISLFVGGCGKSPEEVAQPDGDTQSTEDTQPIDDTQSEDDTLEQPAEVTILTWDKPGETALPWQVDLYEEKMEMFREKYPWIIVDDISLPPGTDYRQKYDQSLLAGEEPTVTGMFPYVDIPTRAKDGSIGDMTEFVENWELRQEGKVFTGFDDAIQVDGKWYAVPRSPYQQTIVINRKLLRDAGMDVDEIPTTWDEFGEFVSGITDASKNRFGFGLMGMEWCAWPFTNFVWNAGGEMGVENPDGTWKLTFAEQPGVDAVMFWHDLIWKYEATQKNVLESYDDLFADFVQGRTAMQWGGISGYINDYVNKYGGDINDLDIMTTPAKAGCESYNLAGGEVTTISPNATKEQREAAWLYIQFMQFDLDILELDAKVNAENGSPIFRPYGRTDIQPLDYAKDIPESWKKKLSELAGY